MKEIGSKLYYFVLDATRQKYFYTSLGVTDNFEGRFELLSIHMFLLMNRLGSQDCDNSKKISQHLVDAMFSDLENGLRSQGMGDFGVGPKMNKFSKHFWGRIVGYENSFLKVDKLEKIINKNLFNGDGSSSNIKSVRAYFDKNKKHLNKLKQKDILEAHKNIFLSPK